MATEYLHFPFIRSADAFIQSKWENTSKYGANPPQFYFHLDTSGICLKFTTDDDDDDDDIVNKIPECKYKLDMQKILFITNTKCCSW